MPIDDVLKPNEAARIAANVYFTLQDWIHARPVAGVESMENVEPQVLGDERFAANLPHADLRALHTARTGLRTSSGFGYTLTFRRGGRTHAVIATRGTRHELPWKPDILTDLRCAAAFGPFGAVHKGFKRTFESLLPSLQRDACGIARADVIHCVGHSLGGAVATLIAGHYARLGRRVRLYSFGSPRVGCWGAHRALERAIGKQHIFRVSHDLDPVSLLGPYPYVHVNPSPVDDHNFTVASPTRQLFGSANHAADQYVATTEARSWSDLRALAQQVDHQNGALARWLLRNQADTSWLQRLSLRSLALLFRIFREELRALSSSAVLALSASDFLAEILARGLHRGRAVSTRIATLLALCAQWSGLHVSRAEELSLQALRTILERMLRTLHEVSLRALLEGRAGKASPLALAIGPGSELAACGAL